MSHLFYIYYIPIYYLLINLYLSLHLLQGLTDKVCFYSYSQHLLGHTLRWADFKFNNWMSFNQSISSTVSLFLTWPKEVNTVIVEDEITKFIYWCLKRLRTYNWMALPNMKNRFFRLCPPVFLPALCTPIKNTMTIYFPSWVTGT